MFFVIIQFITNAGAAKILTLILEVPGKTPYQAVVLELRHVLLRDRKLKSQRAKHLVPG
jgi:hypothetical protein